MAPHQKAAISPRVGGCKDDRDCPDPDSDSKNAEVELKDSKEFVKWQQSDARIAMVTPYRLDEFVDQKKADDLRDFWYDYGKATK